MQRYRDKYLPDASKSTEWTGSPHFASKELLAISPPSIIAAAKCDLLAEEARRFGNALRLAGVDSDLKECKGAKVLHIRR
jgi:acetyl esterase/lipase